MAAIIECCSSFLVMPFSMAGISENLAAAMIRVDD
jgi:hypothetical protein